MPKSARRGNDPAAVLVCKVEKTKWPVERRVDRRARDVRVADFADHDDVGVLAQGRAQSADERIFFADLRLHDAGEVILDRVLDGDDLHSSVAIFFMHAYNAVVLPEPVGPVVRSMPFGFVIFVLDDLLKAHLHAEIL